MDQPLHGPDKSSRQYIASLFVKASKQITLSTVAIKHEGQLFL